MSIGTALALPCAVELRNLPKRDQIRDLIQKDKQGFILKYRRMEGYAQLAQDIEMKMGYLFMETFKYLTLQEKQQLGWQKFHGTVSEYNRLKSLIKDAEKNAKPEFVTKYKRMEGYAKFSEEYFDGNMRKAFLNVSAVLSPREMTQLEWQQFHGFDQEYHDLKSLIIDEKGKIKQEFVGMNGQAEFAEDHFGGIMLRAFLNVSAVLSKSEFKKFGWQQFQGTVSEYNRLKSLITDENGNISSDFLKNYEGMERYAKFAEEYFDGNMRKAFLNVSAVLSPREMTQLEWQQFQGTVQEYHDLKSLIIDEDGNIKQEFVGMNGQAEFSEKHFGGNMIRAFLKVSAVSSKSEFKKLEWQQFQGTVQEYRDLKFLIIDEDGNIKQEFVGMNGQAEFSEKYFDGNMRKAFKNVSAVSSKSEFKKLGWQQFQGTDPEYHDLKFLIKDEDGNIKPEFKGMDGLAKLVEDHFDGNMFKSFKNVSAVLGGAQIMRELGLGWKVFHGTTDQYSALIKLFEETTFEELQNLKGQQRVADLIFEGGMRATYDNVSSLKERLLNKKEDFKNLNWRR